MSKRTIKISGWILTILLGLLFAMSAFMKLSQNEAAIAQAAASGIGADAYRFLGFVELFSLVLFLFPRTGVVGALLLIAYMGGAIATHLQHAQPIAMAVIIEALLWVTLVVRYPELMQRLLPAFSEKVRP